MAGMVDTRPAAWRGPGWRLVLVVGLAHAGLLQWWSADPARAPWPRPEARPAAPLQLVQLKPAPAIALPGQGPREAGAPAAARTTVHRLPAAPRPGRTDPVAADPAPPLPAALRSAADPAAPAADESPATATAMPSWAAWAPPPVYATRLPASARLQFRVLHLGQQGEAVLDWQHDGQQYQLHLAPVGPGRALPEQHSQGLIDAHGLAPERFVDRRRGRGARAANFEREAGRIRFSAGDASFPAWPGAQDRLAWVVQLAAISAAAAEAQRPLPEIQLFVVDARGRGALWRLQAQGDTLVDTPGGPVPARHWRHQAEQPDDLQVDAWLAPTLGHWPARLRYTLPRSGATIEWLLLP
jgi:Protein of unknown function (DUF3108)